MRFTTLGVCLHVQDVSAVATFYVEKLGFSSDLDLGWFVVLHHPDQSGLDLCLVHDDHAALPALAGPVTGTALAFLVDDVDAEYARLSAAGAQFALAPQTEPWGQRRCFLFDPAGTGVELVENQSAVNGRADRTTTT